jgi:N-acetyl-gamma-glutamyl-phosphate reductase
VYPHLRGLTELPFTTSTRAGSPRAPTSCFLALPAHGGRSARCRCCAPAGRKSIDLSADYRLRDPQDYVTWYKAPHIDRPAREAVYGLARAASQGDRRRSAGRVTRLLSRGRDPRDGAAGEERSARLDGIVVDGKSGVTGAGAQGRKVDPMYLYTEANENVQAYGLASHRPHGRDGQELSGLAGSPVKVSFTPHLVPLNRGLFTTASVPLATALTTADALRVYREFYAGETFVRVCGEGERPATRQVVGSNYCDVAVAVDARTNRAVCVSAIDNLGKGGFRQRRAVPEHPLRLARADRARRRAGVPLSRLPEIEWLEGGITAVPGFLAGGVIAGIKPSGKKDLALIHSPTPRARRPCSRPTRSRARRCWSRWSTRAAARPRPSWPPAAAPTCAPASAG